MQSENTSSDVLQNDFFTENLPALIYILDKDFNVRYVNDSVAEKFKCKSCDLIGKSAWGIIGQIETETGRERLKQTVLNGAPLQSMTEVVFPSGKRTLITVMIPFKNSDDIVTDLIGVSYDITGQREKDQIVRNKMLVITGYADMLSEIVEDEQIRALMEKIRKASLEIKSKLDSS